MPSVITEIQFRQALIAKLKTEKVSAAKCVTGPGRSGAVASVYVSHKLRITWIPYGQIVPQELEPVLVVDTAKQSGKTLRKAMRKYNTVLGFAVFYEPPRVRFWYEYDNY